jgi:DNA (cytosine-5)-methyltransferase 1
MAAMNYPAILEEAWAQAIAPRELGAPTVISTFAGGGGSSLGYLMAGYRELLAVEWDDNAVATLRLNFPELDIYHGDIAKLTVGEVLERTELQPGELDVLDGSPPCQGFSTAGKRQMDDFRNGLFREYVRLLQGLQPKAFVMENVSGMVKGKMKLIFVEILQELKASGYQVSARLMNAMYFHVPQSRERMIFVGVREDLGIAPSHPKAECRPFGFSCSESRTEENRATEHEVKIAMQHLARHKAKGNGFGYQVLTGEKPSPTWPKTMMRSTSAPRFVLNREHWFPSSKELSGFGSFPFDYQFAGNYEQQWARIGNSVPPLFMRAIAGHIRREILERIKQRSDILTIEKDNG